MNIRMAPTLTFTDQFLPCMACGAVRMRLMQLSPHLLGTPTVTPAHLFVNGPLPYPKCANVCVAVVCR